MSHLILKLWYFKADLRDRKQLDIMMVTKDLSSRCKSKKVFKTNFVEKTRAFGATGAGLLLDRKKMKTFLHLRPEERSFVNRRLLHFLDLFAVEIYFSMMFTFSLVYASVFGNRQISSL